MTITFEKQQSSTHLSASMAMSNKEVYLDFCQSGVVLPLYMQPWWLDAVCHKGIWDVCLSFDNAGSINGCLVYYLVKLRGVIPAIVNPDLTPHTGIWMVANKDFGKTKLHNQYAYTKKVVSALVEQLPEVGLYHQKLHHSLNDWQPFFWKGYKGSTHYTYLLENIGDLNTIYDHFKGSVRTDIRKAEKSIRIEASEDITGFYRLCELSFGRQGLKPNFSKEAVLRLDKVLMERGLRDMYVAKDLDGAVHAAIYIVYSEDTAHYLIGGSDPDLRSSSSVTYLLWHAIQYASRRAAFFDFEGSMLPAVEYSFRNFGAVQKPFFRITKAKNVFYEALTLLFKDYK